MQVKPYIKRCMAGLLLLTLTLTMFPLSALAGKYSMSYIYFGKPSKYVQAVDQTQDSLDMISPSYFDLNKDGSLLLSPALDPSFITEMHRRGIKVIPFLSNHWDREVGKQAMRNKDKLVKQIAEAVKKYNLDGVNVDIENLTTAERDVHTEFVRMLKKALPADKEVSVAVAANPHGWKTGWHGSYDYKALADACDYLIMMTYDQSYRGGPAGPVASLSFVEKSIQEGLKDIPKHKLIMGIPTFGRYWNEDGSIKGDAIQHSRIDSLVKQYGGQFSYDNKSESAKATFTIKKGDPLPTIHDKKLTPGNYTVWYDNNRSIKAKLGLVSKYDLKGAGVWSLNEDSGDLWNNYRSWLNGVPYLDTVGHWAEQSISMLQDKGWMTGLKPNYFAPNAALTRAQAASILVRANGLNGNPTPSGGKQRYWDVPVQHWAAEAIHIASAAGLVSGMPDGSFAPNRAVTREEIAVMINRLVKQSPSSKTTRPAIESFKDVTPSRWSYKAIMELTNKGIVSGYKDGTFRPVQQVTRAEMASMLYIAFK
ncbi:S-layer homology domain-containing protein [Paenibacillus arenosi]|uniref:S-layer homology domain-containing protein n=1 Tax=Paenibacillus arenosi TaxID=2774142 RepID=A0ABR9AX61_9BACL|nr:S-layer homology domain-containing protein [Paenibacillus arenosi]MBD8498718.1 S-layer homology domain-containing protein [Paenibacillus arenosi]